MSKAKPSKVARANAHEKEPPMPVRTPKGRRTRFTDMTVKGAVAAVKAQGAKKKPARRT